MKEFLSYILSGNASGDFTRKLENEVAIARQKDEWRSVYMLLVDRDREIADMSRREERQSLIVDLFKDGDISAATAAKRLGKTPDEFDALLKSLQSNRI